MFELFKPAAHTQRLPSDKVDSVYSRLRWQLFIGIFVGYAGYYLVRKNFSLAMPYLIEQGFSRGDLGVALGAVSIAYGLSKFLMGNVSDRSNPRYFLSAGRSTPFGTSDVLLRLYAMGNGQHYCHVYSAVLKRLVPRHGLACLWPYYGALVVTQRAW